jgi:hypothetical protein
MTIFAQSQNSKPSIEITKVSLIAREEKTPPIGQPSNSNRDIGFASVSLRLNNHREVESQMTVIGISIVDTNNQIEEFEFTKREIKLRPLENLEEVLQLRNKRGYITGDRVKAVITYQIGDHVGFMESETVEIVRS